MKTASAARHGGAHLLNVEIQEVHVALRVPHEHSARYLGIQTRLYRETYAGRGERTRRSVHK